MTPSTEQSFEPIEAIAAKYVEARRIPELHTDEETGAGRANWSARDVRDSRVMIIDDELVNIKVVREYLRLEGFENFIGCDDPRGAMETIRRDRPDVVVLDLMMPHVSGLDLLHRIRSDSELTDLPIVILTASDDHETRERAIREGATDFLTKPVDPTELLPRIRNAAILKAHSDTIRQYTKLLEGEVERRTAELNASRIELLHCLARVSEFRDNETGRHVIRVGHYAGIIARALGLDPTVCELIELAAPLHDMGKIGIPDAILNKNGSLDEDETEIMRRHCDYGKAAFDAISTEEWRSLAAHTSVGESIMEAARSPILEIASRIALTHHERWDGTGYPLGLSGEDIPIEGRITSVADVFDALSSRRPYKPAYPLEKCLQIMKNGRGTQFDPNVLDVFVQRREEIVRVMIGFTDTE